ITCQAENHDLPRRIIDNIRVNLRQTLQAELESHSWRLKVLTAGLIVLRIVEEAASYVQDYRKSIADSDTGKYWDLNKIKDINKLTDPKLEMLGLDLRTIQDCATHILGKTPAELMMENLKGWRILHCENVLRRDLQSRFISNQQKMREQLIQKPIEHLRAFVPYEHRRIRGRGIAAKEQLVDYLVKPRITFHGTRRDIVSSIVQHGFLKPGSLHPITKKPLGIRNGSMYGRGIYSSPDPGYAIMYSGMEAEPTKTSAIPGIKLIVCGTIMGQTAKMTWDDNWHDRSDPYTGVDSHCNESELAYVVFKEAQIIPCYVLHLDWTGKSDEEVQDWIIASTGQAGQSKRSRDKEPTLAPGDLQRLKEEKLARARKFFAYGFGPISGDRIVIEDVGETDDDEENYGEYQANRIDSDSTQKSPWDWGVLEGETEFDEYADARKA
ncbi:hypothetical protein K432DRAFT_255229, partial [Lepidopterella palustris CBS 459.81]